MQHKLLILVLSICLNSIILYSQDSFEATLNKELTLIQSPLKFTAGPRGFNIEKLSMGIKGGVNFSMIIPISRNSIFSGANGDYDKDYSPFFTNVGSQYGFIVRYSITGDIKVSIQPSINSYSFKYNNEYEWLGTSGLNYNVDHRQNLRFFEIPLIVGYYIRAKQWQPYIQAGAYYGLLLNSNTFSDVTETTTSQTVNYSTIVNSNNIYRRNQFGLLGGAGIRYAAGKTMIGLEANYRFLLSSLSSTESRYANNQVTGNYDITDKLLFNNIAISLSITVPLVCKDDTKGPFMFCKAE